MGTKVYGIGISVDHGISEDARNHVHESLMRQMKAMLPSTDFNVRFRWRSAETMYGEQITLEAEVTTHNDEA